MKTDAERLFFEDVRDKKNISHSASHKRTHCGKGGTVRFPSDKLTKKELEKMNGECEVYRLNEPMKWAEFIAMPKEHQITYIQKLRNKYNVPDTQISRMFGVVQSTISSYTRKLGIPSCRKIGDRSSWDKDGWYIFLRGGNTLQNDAADEESVEINADEDITPEEAEFICEQAGGFGETQYTHYDESATEPVPFEEDEPVPVFEECCKTIEPLIPIVPCSGTMSFEGNFDDVLKALSVMIGSGKGKIHIAWDVA